MLENAHTLTIRTQTKDEKEPIFKEYTDKLKLGELTGVGILENGTTGGKTSCALFISLDDGSVVFAELTANMMESIAASVRGSVARFEGDENSEQVQN